MIGRTGDGDVDRVVRVRVPARPAGTDVAAGVVHQDVDGAEGGLGLGHDAVDVLGDHEVANDADGLGARRRADVGGGLGESRTFACGRTRR